MVWCLWPPHSDILPSYENLLPEPPFPRAVWPASVHSCGWRLARDLTILWEYGKSHHHYHFQLWTKQLPRYRNMSCTASSLGFPEQDSCQGCTESTVSVVRFPIHISRVLDFKLVICFNGHRLVLLRLLSWKLDLRSSLHKM